MVVIVCRVVVVWLCGCAVVDRVLVCVCVCVCACVVCVSLLSVSHLSQPAA